MGSTGFTNCTICGRFGLDFYAPDHINTPICPYCLDVFCFCSDPGPGPLYGVVALIQDWPLDSADFRVPSLLGVFCVHGKLERFGYPLGYRCQAILSRANARRILAFITHGANLDW